MKLAEYSKEFSVTNNTRNAEITNNLVSLKVKGSNSELTAMAQSVIVEYRKSRARKPLGNCMTVASIAMSGKVGKTTFAVALPVHPIGKGATIIKVDVLNHNSAYEGVAIGGDEGKALVDAALTYSMFDPSNKELFFDTGAPEAMKFINTVRGGTNEADDWQRDDSTLRAVIDRWVIPFPAMTRDGVPDTDMMNDVMHVVSDLIDIGVHVDNIKVVPNKVQVSAHNDPLLESVEALGALLATEGVTIDFTAIIFENPYLHELRNTHKKTLADFLAHNNTAPAKEIAKGKGRYFNDFGAARMGNLPSEVVKSCSAAYALFVQLTTLNAQLQDVRQFIRR